VFPPLRGLPTTARIFAISIPDIHPYTTLARRDIIIVL
jgi:hypothetical protein